jgi:hypothetical protein
MHTKAFRPAGSSRGAIARAVVRWRKAYPGATNRSTIGCIETGRERFELAQAKFRVLAIAVAKSAAEGADGVVISRVARRGSARA